MVKFLLVKDRLICLVCKDKTMFLPNTLSSHYKVFLNINYCKLEWCYNMFPNNSNVIKFTNLMSTGKTTLCSTPSSC